MKNLQFPFSLSSPTPSTSRHHFESPISTRIRILFHDLHNTIANFLKNLNFTYYQNGINFDVTQYQHMLIRLLTPYQLLEKYRITDAGGLLDQKIFGKGTMRKQQQQDREWQNKKHLRDDYKYIDKQIHRQKTQKQSQNKKQPKHKKQNPHKKPSSNLLRLPIVPSLPSLQPIQPQIFQRHIKIKTKAMLQTDQQAQVQQFIIENVKKGRRLSLKDIADKAKYVSKRNYERERQKERERERERERVGEEDNGMAMVIEERRKSKNCGKFQASIGWVRHFLKRFPDMRKLYEYSKENKTLLQQRQINNKQYQQILSKNNYYRPKNNNEEIENQQSQLEIELIQNSSQLSQKNQEQIIKKSIQIQGTPTYKYKYKYKNQNQHRSNSQSKPNKNAVLNGKYYLVDDDSDKDKSSDIENDDESLLQKYDYDGKQLEEKEEVKEQGQQQKIKQYQMSYSESDDQQQNAISQDVNNSKQPRQQNQQQQQHQHQHQENNNN